MGAASLIAALEVAEISARSVEFFSFKYAFVARALAASILVGGLCGAVGTFLVLRRLSLMGDAAGHSTLPGICVAFLLAGSVSTLPIMAGALVSALLAALAVGVIARGPRSRSDAAIGIVLSVFFGAGIVLLSYIQRVATTSYAGLDAMLLGNVAGISPGQLSALGVVTLLLGGMTAVYLRPLSISTFDPGFAASVGIPVRAIHYGLLGALSLSVVVSVQAVGVVLVSAMLIIPGASAVYWFKRMPGVLGAAVVLGALSGALGAWISYIFEGVSTGPAMVLVATAFFSVSLAFGPRGGLLWRAVRRRRRQRVVVANVGGGR
jgi:manganese/zinc/iron transport system permease protein